MSQWFDGILKICQLAQAGYNGLDQQQHQQVNCQWLTHVSI